MIKTLTTETSAVARTPLAVVIRTQQALGRTAGSAVLENLVSTTKLAVFKTAPNVRTWGKHSTLCPKTW